MRKLSEKIKERRTDRLDEWSMDELSSDVSKLEKELDQCYERMELLFDHNLDELQDADTWFYANGKAIRGLK